MLKTTRIQRYKSLLDVSVDLEPLTVFIGPNGSGKSSYCEALSFFSEGLQHKLVGINRLDDETSEIFISLAQANRIGHQGPLEAKFSFGETDKPMALKFSGELPVTAIYDFIPTEISNHKAKTLSSSGAGLADSLTQILLDDRDRFIELEKRFTSLVPNISRIKLVQEYSNGRLENLLSLVDSYSAYAVPASSVSDGTLRILAFLTALYDVSQPGLICFEEPENGIHPWLLNKLMELLKTVSTKGINGSPTQIIITTHSPVLLNFVEPKQIRAVELDDEGRTIINSLPFDTKRFQAAMDAYDGELGELWYTNLFGGNPV